MFLRALTVRGFKSFADKTTLEFTPGISVIVGPNGSGKSNISDAIAWVLGEQGPRALRGAQMADVIFAGSPSRPPLGMAEVSLVIDNSAGLIPVPASEIEISRTLFRSGESEYRLGGRPCRLLDIQELLSDTGMGRALHTIIGQGALDDVLSARPEERRQFIEDAAGVAKHRRRRERAARKLAGMEGDLVRLHDLVGELRRQLKPLKQQAELAGRYETLQREAEDLARKLAGARLRDLLLERDRRRPGWDEAERREGEARSGLAELDGRISVLEAERADAEDRARAAEEAFAAAGTAKSEAETRLRAAMAREARARERLAVAENRSGRLFALEEELARTERARSEVDAALAMRAAELEHAETAYREAERSRRDAEEERRRAHELNMARRTEMEALRHALDGHAAELARLAASARELDRRLATASARAADLDSEIQALDARDQPLSREQGELGAERSSLSHELARLEAEERGLVARQASVEARRVELADTPGAAFARRRGDRPLGLIADLIAAPPQLRAAVRGALGAFGDAVVYSSDEEAVRDAPAGEGAGVLLAAADGEARYERIPGERALLEAMDVDSRITALAERLLGRTYLVRNLAEAVARHRVHPDAHFVTPEGAVVGPSFIHTSPGQDPRLEAIRRESGGIERDLGSVRRRIREARQRMAQVDSRLEFVRAHLEETDARITAAAEELAAARADLVAAERERSWVGDRLAAVRAAHDIALERLSQIPAERDELPLPPAHEPPVPQRAEVEALRRDRDRLEAGVARARREMERLAAEDPIELRGLLAEAEAERATAEGALSRAEADLGPAGQAHRSAGADSRDVRTRHEAANRSWREAAAALDAVRAAHEDEVRARDDVERRVADAERVIREGHGAEPSAVLAELAGDDGLEELQRRSDLVARRLGLLGKVNLLASGELESLEQRHDFLARELEDVRSARRDLERLIEDIDVQMAELFESAFRDVSEQFVQLFGQLFPGGEGRLTLTDPGDPLGSGIEVEARPGRKRVKRLSLLSGGERALAALAFLFAIFRARPSPFYLMDEVEAALDDVNLHRFLDLVREFALDSQILLVTHQKRTMEMADVLYGVTMGQGGASAVISQRLAEVHAG